MKNTNQWNFYSFYGRYIKLLVLVLAFIVGLTNSYAYSWFHAEFYTEKYYLKKEEQCKSWTNTKLSQLKKKSIIVSKIDLLWYNYNRLDGNCYASISESITYMKWEKYMQSIAASVYLVPKMKTLISSYTEFEDWDFLSSNCSSFVWQIECTDYEALYAKYFSN